MSEAIEEVPSISELASQGEAAIKQDIAGDKPQSQQTTPEAKPVTQKQEAAPPKADKQVEQKTPETDTTKEQSKDSPIKNLMGKKDKATAKPAEATDEEGKVIDWKTAPAKLRKAFEQRDAEAAALRAEKQRLADEIAAIKSKPTETKADTKLLEQYQNELKNLKQTLRELEYKRSDEFKEKFVNRFNKTYQQAITEVTQLQARVDDDGNTRPATQADFDTLRALPFGQRRQAARKLFGEDADVALGHVSNLERIIAESNEAVEQEKANYEKTQAEKQMAMEREKGEFQSMFDQGRNEIYEMRPEYFKPSPEDAEAARLLQDGQSFAKDYSENFDKLDVPTRAAYKAVAMARIESWPLIEHMLTAEKAKSASLEAEIEKLRGTDPGAAGKGKQVESKKAEEEVPGFADIEKQFNLLPKD